MDIIKQTTVYIVGNDAEAEALVAEIKNKNMSNVVDSKIDHKNKKSKGEIIDEWCQVTITVKYTD